MTQFSMCIGISGSGKSTYLKNFPKESIICPDDIRRELTGDISDQTQNNQVWRIAKERILERLAKGEDTILDATNVISKYRKQFLNGIPKGIELVAVVFPLPDIDESFKRIQKDLKEGVDRSNVPLHIIQRQAESYERGIGNLKDQFDKIIFINDDLTERSIVSGIHKD